jgi:hypothetical protein
MSTYLNNYSDPVLQRQHTIEECHHFVSRYMPQLFNRFQERCIQVFDGQTKSWWRCRENYLVWQWIALLFPDKAQKLYGCFGTMADPRFIDQHIFFDKREGRHPVLSADYFNIPEEISL